MPEVEDATAEAPVSTPAGWYPDPWRQHERRYWDGTQWTGRTEDSAAAVAAPSPAPPRRVTPVGILVGVATVAAGVLAVLSFGKGREKLALVAVALVLPLVAANVIDLARSPNRARRSVLTVAVTWFVLVAVIAVGGYRGFQHTSCISRLGPNATLAGCGLSGRDLTKFDLRGADLSNADLSDADLSHVDLAGATLDGATLRSANLTSATLDGAKLHAVVLDGATLESASLQKANLSNAKLHNVIAIGASLSDADLRSAEIDNTDFTSAKLDGADLSGAVLEDTNLGSASLTVTNFENATLTNVTLDDAFLEGVVGLSDTALAGAFGVDPLDVAKTLSARGLFLESEAANANAAAAVCSGTPMSGTATSPSNGAFVVVVNQGSTTFEWPTHVPARRFLELVACVGPITSADVDECGPYFYADGSPAHGITRYRQSVVVTLVNPATAAVVATRTLDGGDPDPCPITISASVYRLGNDIDEATVDAGITAMVSAAGV